MKAGAGFFALRMVGDLRSLPMVLHLVRDFALINGAPRPVADQLAVAAEELCSNIYLHAYGGKESSGPLRIEGRLKQNQLQLMFLHQGKTIMEEQLPDACMDIGPGRTGGMGLVMALRASDRLAILRRRGWSGFCLERDLGSRPALEAL